MATEFDRPRSPLAFGLGYFSNDDSADGRSVQAICAAIMRQNFSRVDPDRVAEATAIMVESVLGHDDDVVDWAAIDDAGHRMAAALAGASPAMPGPEAATPESRLAHRLAKPLSIAAVQLKLAAGNDAYSSRPTKIGSDRALSVGATGGWLQVFLIDDRIELDLSVEAWLSSSPPPRVRAIVTGADLSVEIMLEPDIDAPTTWHGAGRWPPRRVDLMIGLSLP